MTDQNQEQITARKIVELLDEIALDVDAEVSVRLATSRQQAVAAMGQAQHWVFMQPAVVGWNHLQQLSGHGGSRFWLPVIFLLAALAAVFSSNWNTQSQHDIDMDSLLLASELPPEAYADKEFVAWLETTSHQ